MNGPAEHGIEWSLWAILGGLGLAMLKKVNPRPAVNALVRFSFGPVVQEHLAPMVATVNATHSDMQDVKRDVHQIQRKFDHLPHAAEAHAAVAAEDAEHAKHWGT